MAKTKRATEIADVLIGGAGFAGLALAIALRQTLGQSFAVTVADPSLDRGHAGDARASAIAAAARRLFETIGIWDAVAADAQPILDMVVTDSKLGDAIRPVFLTFAGDVAPGEPFAHMVENAPLFDALSAKAKDVGVDLRPAAVADFEVMPASVAVRFSDSKSMSSRLLVAADGARSSIRERAGIQCMGWS
jgi:2-octaprenyl-6-methoxyphenol hydroxylase